MSPGYSTDADQSSGSRAGLVHIADAIAHFFSDLEREIQAAIEVRGGFRGRVRPPQRPWSEVLDQVAAEKDKAA